MPRKSEVMQMDLQREFSTTMTTLKDIWDELGMPDDQIEIRGNTVRLHIRTLLSEMVREETQLKERMLESISKYKTDISELCDKLTIHDFEIDDSEMTVMQREKTLRTHLTKLKSVKAHRIADFKTLQEVHQHLCDQLSAIPYYIPSNAIPSEKQLSELRDRISSLKEEKQRRCEDYKSKKSQIICLYDELQLLPETSFALDLINEMEESFSLSTASMANLTDLHKELSKKRHDRQLIVDGLWSQITFLWDRLEIDDAARRSLRETCRGIRSSDVEGLRKELANLEVLKQASLKKLTERCRTEIATLWEKCFYSKDQRHQFSPAYDEEYTEDLLNCHEEELARMHAYFEEHKVMFTDVRKWQSLFNRMLELESKASDINRYANRGGNLLQEEKERKRICKQLPKIENELFQEIDKWENENGGQKFLVEGTEFRDYVHCQWEAFDTRKENEKMQRQERKRQEMESEMTYGSAPKTPTKRRFIGTSTLLKTPDSKKSRKLADCTSRSVLSTNRFNINRTAATCMSPGKPPYGRSNPVTPKRKLPMHKKTICSASESCSIKSAPSSAQKPTMLSTTVVSSNTATSAQSAPLRELDPSRYQDFASGIEHKVKQNRVVRSSAIHE